jgi:hypothetical protein
MKVINKFTVSTKKEKRTKKERNGYRYSSFSFTSPCPASGVHPRSAIAGSFFMPGKEYKNETQAISPGLAIAGETAYQGKGEGLPGTVRCRGT